MDIFGNGQALGGLAHMFGNTDVHGRDNKANLQIQRETNAMNYLMQQETNAQNYKIWQEQKQNNLDMWHMENEYNSASAQRQRLEDAGLNPYLMMNGGSAGVAGSVDSAAPPTMQSATMQSPNLDNSYTLNKFNSISSAVQDISNKLYDFRLQNAQASKLESENLTNDLNNLFLADYLKSRNKGAKANASSAESRAVADKVASEIAKETKQNVIDKSNYETASARQGAFLAEQLVIEKDLDIEAKQTLNKYLAPQQALNLLKDLSQISLMNADIQYKKAATSFTIEQYLGARVDRQIKEATKQSAIDAIISQNGYTSLLYGGSVFGMNKAQIDLHEGYKRLKAPIFNTIGFNGDAGFSIGGPKGSKGNQKKKKTKESIEVGVGASGSQSRIDYYDPNHGWDYYLPLGSEFDDLF